MSEPLTLYDFHGSPCARRVRIVMLEKGLEWQTRLVDLTRMEQKRPEYLKLNPNGLVPTLVHGDRVIYESNVITEYLDAVFPQPRLYPADPWPCACAKMWQAFELAMAKEYRPLMYLRVIGPLDRQRPKDEVMRDARRSTDDPAHLDWVSRVYDGTVLDENEAAHFGQPTLPSHRSYRERAGRERAPASSCSATSSRSPTSPYILASRCTRWSDCRLIPRSIHAPFAGCQR